MSIDEAICGVCLETFQKVARVDTPCGHSYCDDCLSQVVRLARPLCPLCRTPLVARVLKYHDGRAFVREAKASSLVTASVGCVWRYSDQFERRVGGHDLLTADSWLVVDVSYYHVGAEAQAVPPGTYTAAFRVKRLSDLRFPGEVALYLDGTERRTVSLTAELPTGAWSLLDIGDVDIALARDVSASMRALDQTAPKNGLVVDCLVLYPPDSPPPSLILKHDDSRCWFVVERDDTIRLRRGSFTMDNQRFKLRETNPVSFVYTPNPDVVYSLSAVHDNQLVWESNQPDVHGTMRWRPRNSYGRNGCTLS